MHIFSAIHKPEGTTYTPITLTEAVHRTTLQRHEEIVIMDEEKRTFLTRHGPIAWWICKTNKPITTHHDDHYQITGRTIMTYDTYLTPPEKNLISVSERARTHRNRPYVELGPGFSALVIREAHARTTGIPPIIIDSINYETLITIITAMEQEKKEPLHFEAGDTWMTSTTLLERLTTLTNPTLITHINHHFTHAQHLPTEAQTLLKQHGGIHTLIDYQAAHLRSDPKHLRGLRPYLAEDGKAYSY
ncbi:MAG: hypothetical protein Q7R96_04755 [Nanoarchaeota archaeon]|nr:hypothetical protein [Nanoarchaeota archaeon]